MSPEEYLELKLRNIMLEHTCAFLQATLHGLKDSEQKRFFKSDKRVMSVVDTAIQWLDRSAPYHRKPTDK